MAKKIYRIIDANLNRSREGLRVCEDIARFALDSKILTDELKIVRHRISDIAKSSALEFKGLADARNSEGDILRRSRFESEMKRRGLSDIFAANIERVKESLRVLEEVFKLIDVKNSSKFCYLRFRVYAIEEKAISSLRSRLKLTPGGRSNPKKV
ncbi:MAG: thiamine-phosphate pyrophosphorylase [Candidatus Omnitrophota bacterium]|nr:thiamine-phosphate pyrophosphorylase [Candidatus Omnitrophota bacterium]